MDLEKVRKRFLPMTETMLLILFSLREERHGYAVMQHVEKITNGRIHLGAGTVYQSLSKLEHDKLIRVTSEADRRKNYVITEMGSQILKEEMQRIEGLYELFKHVLNE